MSEHIRKYWGRWGGSVGISLALHALVVLVVFINLPFTLSSPEKEETVSVELVPPPEEQSPIGQSDEQPVEPESQSDKDQTATETQDEEPPPPVEDTALEEPPARPVEQPPVEQPAEPPAAPESAAEEQALAKPPSAAASGEQGAENETRIPIPVLRPVFEFGDDGSGKRQTLDGDSVEEGAEATEDTPTAEGTEAAKSTEVEAEEAQVADTAALTEKPPGIDILGSGPGADGIALGALTQGDVTVSDSSDDPTATALEGAADRPELDEAKTLFSRDATDDTVAVTAMANIPRGIRADQLCLTELREQLRNGTPPYWPELLPSHRLDEGTVFEVRDSAFRAKGLWYNLDFRCEIDEQATKVVSFALKIGTAIPRDDWKRRRLPH